MTENETPGRGLPDDTHLAYTVRHETYYAGTLPGEPEVIVMASAKGSGGGVAWEFGVTDGASRIGRGLELRMWDDAWAAFAQLPDFFAALAAGEVASLDDVRALLDRLGAVDETDRVSPLQNAEG